ncbi:MAG: site-2 protease family protein [Acidobacteria bacterium]|nr:site-2 protease family protein [Acidobacteriota bacterium]
MHPTFLLLLVFVGWQHWLLGKTIAAVFGGIVFILALFACVVLHELGHALTARRYGIKTKDITLLPIGGVARLERMPSDPIQELWVALAGPAVNVVIAGLLYAWLWTTSSLAPIEEVNVVQGPFLERLMMVNAFLVGFNLLPAFPMDGGRVLRALLATRMEYTRATQLAATLGQSMAFLFGFLGLTSGNPFLIFIALFVWIGAAQEASVVQMKSALGGIPVSRAMITAFHPLAPDDSLKRAVELLLTGTEQDFPVMLEGHVVGVLTLRDLQNGLARKGDAVAVGEVMRRDVPVVDANDMLESVFQALQSTGARIAAVVRDGRVVGLVTPDNVGEFVMVQSSLAAHRGRRPG